MSFGSEEYQQALTDIEEAYKSGLRAFAKWCAESWKLEDQDRKEAGMSADYQRGWNAGMEAVDAALDLFLDEHHH